MPVINLEQGSESWKEWRKSKITATDISIILGSNPWKTRLELWEEKLGLRKPQELNDAMKRGQKLEPEARKIASELISVNFDPCVYESDKYPWLIASLDGMGTSIKNEYILEIKCPKELTHLAAINGNVPEYYIDQIQTQLLVTGATLCYYFSYRPEYNDQTYTIIEFRPDYEKFERIIEKGHEFYIQMCTMNAPKEWKFKERK